jgi:rhodanese-related sulfurtransferase
MIRLLKYGSVISLVLFLSGCAPRGQQPETHSFGAMQVQLWSMPFGCEGGLRLDGSKLTAIDRHFLTDYHQWTLDMSNGRILDQSDQPVDRTRLPADTHAEISGGSLRPLRASLVRSITPTGFDPVVVTDRFIFAKRTWWSLAFPKFVHHGQVVVIDRPSQSIVWRLDGVDIAVQASPTYVVVCDYERIAAFLPQASRPQEITDFYSAIRRGDVKEVAGLFQAWKRTPLYDLDGDDPPSLAAREGQVEVVRQLLALKLSPDARSADGFSPLLMALHWEHPEIVSILLEAGADPNYNAHYWGYPLTAAVHAGSRQTIESLLQKGARINAASRWGGTTALHEAVMYRNYEAVQTLLKAGADSSIKDEDGKTPVEMAQFDECIPHLFGGGKISDRPIACAPVKRSTASFDASAPSHGWH